MAYIKRDLQGKICALFENDEGELENIDFDHPELINFLARCDREEYYQLMKSDLQFIRVLEDLVDVLIRRNIITITDFPKPVIDKLLARQSIRKRLTGAISMEINHEV